MNPEFINRNVARDSSCRLLILTPLEKITPLFGESNPPNKFSRVVFPAPDGPLIITNVDSLIPKETSSTALTIKSPIS